MITFMLGQNLCSICSYFKVVHAHTHTHVHFLWHGCVCCLGLRPNLQAGLQILSLQILEWPQPCQRAGTAARPSGKAIRTIPSSLMLRHLSSAQNWLVLHSNTHTHTAFLDSCRLVAGFACPCVNIHTYIHNITLHYSTLHYIKRKFRTKHT